MAGSETETIGVLASGGLDSSILVGDLARRGRRVQPFYIRTGVVWQGAELAALERFLAAIDSRNVTRLVCLDLPLADVYGEHWSLTAEGTPAADSEDEAVFLPGRNALLLVKPAVWCQLHGVCELAMAPLGTSPFEDARAAFVRDFEAALNRGSAAPVRLRLPFSEMKKQQVMALGRELPLELTFSCIAPKTERGIHCGRCNKCAERQAAFKQAQLEDRTEYAQRD